MEQNVGRVSCLQLKETNENENAKMHVKNEGGLCL